MVEQTFNHYKITLEDRAFVVDGINPVDDTATYITGAARPEPAENGVYSEQEDENFSYAILTALGFALGKVDPETTITVEAKGAHLAQLGNMLQAMVGQLSAA